MFLLMLTWLSIAVIAFFTVVMLVVVQTSHYQERLVFRFWQRVGLPSGTDDIATAVRRRIRYSTSASLTGALIGLLVSVVALYVNPSLASASFIWLFIVPAVLTGMVALDVGFSLRDSLFRQGKDSPRIARSRVTTMRDYVSPWRLRLAPVFALIATVLSTGGMLLGLLGVIDGATFIRSPALPLLAVALIVFFVGMAVERRVLRHPQPATDTLELAWDDAFKASTFRALRLFETIVAWLAVAAAGIGMLQGFDALTGTSWSTGAGPQLFTWGYLATLSCFSFGQAQTYFRHRLWPDLTEVSAGNTTGSH